MQCNPMMTPLDVTFCQFARPFSKCFFAQRKKRNNRIMKRIGTNVKVRVQNTCDQISQQEQMWLFQ